MEKIEVEIDNKFGDTGILLTHGKGITFNGPIGKYYYEICDSDNTCSRGDFEIVEINSSYKIKGDEFSFINIPTLYIKTEEPKITVTLQIYLD